jgi:hypothetical protein
VSAALVSCVVPLSWHEDALQLLFTARGATEPWPPLAAVYSVYAIFDIVGVPPAHVKSFTSAFVTAPPT